MLLFPALLHILTVLAARAFKVCKGFIDAFTHWCEYSTDSKLNFGNIARLKVLQSSLKSTSNNFIWHFINGRFLMQEDLEPRRAT